MLQIFQVYSSNDRLFIYHTRGKFKKDKHTKRCILQIRNTDNLCTLWVIITALTHHTNIILGRQLNVNDITYIRKGRPLQTDLAVQLCLEIGEVCFYK